MKILSHRRRCKVKQMQSASNSNNLKRATSKQVQFTAKPMTQQGLASFKQINQHREVHDKTYFMNLYKKRIEALDYELISLDAKLKTNNDLNALELQQRVTKAELEVKQWHDQLSVLNIYLEKQRTMSTIDDLNKELLKLKKSREMDMDQVEQVFVQKQEKEINVNALKKTVLLLQEDMDSMMKESPYYQQYMDKSSLIQNNVNQTQDLKSHAKQIKNQIDIISLKIDAKGDVYKEYKSKLLEYTRKSMELQRINQKPKQQDLQKLIQQTQFELNVLEQQLQQNLKEVEIQNIKNQHQLAIQSENEMIDFLTQQVTQTPMLHDELEALQNEIKQLQQFLSNPLPVEFPSPEKYQDMQQLLQIKQVEVTTAESTFEALLLEKQTRLSEIHKLDLLSGKLDDELDALAEKLQLVDAKVMEYANMDETKRQLEGMKRDLLQNKAAMELQMTKITPMVEELEVAMTQVQNKLAMDTQHSDYITLLMKLNMLRAKIVSSQKCSHFTDVDVFENKPTREKDTLKAKVLALIQKLNDQNIKLSQRLPKPTVTSQ